MTVKSRFGRFLCWIFGHDWNYYALLDSKTGEFFPACNRCGVEKEESR